MNVRGLTQLVRQSSQFCENLLKQQISYRALKNDKSAREYKVGDRVIVDGVVRAVVEHPDGSRLQVDYGNNQTGLFHRWQVSPADSFDPL